MTFSISDAAALSRNRDTQGSIDWTSEEVRGNAREVLRELVTKAQAGRVVIGQGTQGDDAAALQYALMAVTGGQQRITVDGIFGSRSSHQSTDLLRDVQAALGERWQKYQGTGGEAAGLNTFVAMHNYLASGATAEPGAAAAPGASPLQLGLRPPEPAAGTRQLQRRARLAEFERLATAEPAVREPAPGDDASRVAPGAPALAPAAITDEATARAAIVAVADRANPQRTDVLGRLGAAARGPAEGVDNPAVVRGGVAELTAGDNADATSHRILDFLGANAGKDNTAMLTALRATPAWEQMRRDAGDNGFDRTGISPETYALLAGAAPRANAPAAEQETWLGLRAGEISVKMRMDAPLNQDDLYVATRFPNGAPLLLRGTQADAVAAVRRRVNELNATEASQLLATIHGPADGQVTPELQRRRAIAYAVVKQVFESEGVTDPARYQFFSALAAPTNPVLATMPTEQYSPLRDRIYATSTGWIFGRGDRYVVDMQDALYQRRLRLFPQEQPRGSGLRGEGYFPLG